MCYYYRLLSFHVFCCSVGLFFFLPFLKSFCNEWDAYNMDLNVILCNKNNKQVHCIVFKWKALKVKVMWLLLHLFPM